MVPIWIVMPSYHLSSPLRRGVVSISKKIKLRNASTAKASRPDPRYVNLRNAPVGFDVASAVVYPGFLTDEEGKSLIKEAGKRLKRRRFENGHWDSVITGYREVEMSTHEEQFLRQPDNFGTHTDTSDESRPNLPLFGNVIAETRRHLAENHFGDNGDGSTGGIRWLPSHAIDLSANGELTAHVDSVKFSGEIVAGISLLSDAIMRLRPSSKEWDSEEQDSDSQSSDYVVEQNCDDSKGYVDLYLPQLSLYVLSGMSRYSYTHELLPSGSTFHFSEMRDVQSPNMDQSSVDVVRGRRLSIIFRDANCNQSFNS